jgi:predicted RecA/RadA family phage recombinase
MANTRRTDGKAVQLVAPVAVEAGEPVLINGWHGVAVRGTQAGDLVAVEVEASVHELELASGATGAEVGDIVYIHGDTEGEDVALNLTATGGVAFAKIVEVDDDNELIVLGRLLENRPDATS